MAYNSMEKIWIVIPAYNEEKIIQEVIREVQSAHYQNIIVVDDGSQDDTFEKSQAAGAIALHHRLNRGKGAAHALTASSEIVAAATRRASLSAS